MTRFTKLAVCDPGELIFGRAPRPLHCGFDLAIGAGEVFPEVNFTQPSIEVNEKN